MLLNDHWDTPAMKMIRNEIGTDRTKKSFIYKCKASCRSAANEFNNLHSKLYLFSQAGKSKDVIATGSANMTRNADIHQWNDLYFMSGEHEIFRQFVGLFNDMKNDYNTRQDPLFFCGVPTGAVCDDSVDKHTVWAFPRVSGPKNDLVLDTLDKVQCLTPDAEGNVVRTKLALSMHTMRGNRGNYLAEAIRKKWAQGCDVRVMFGLIGYHTKGVIAAPTARGRIPLRSTGLDYNTRRQLRPQQRRRGRPDPRLLQPPEVPGHPGHLQRHPRHRDGHHRVVELGQPQHGQRRDLVHRPRRPGRQEVPRQLRLPVEPQAQLARRLHDELRELPGQADVRGATAKRWVTERRKVTTLGPGELRHGSLLGERLTHPARGA